MTLRDKLNEKLSESFANEIEQIVDNYIIEFLEIYHNGIFHIPLKEGEAKKIVEYIKSKKEL